MFLLPNFSSHPSLPSLWCMQKMSGSTKTFKLYLYSSLLSLFYLLNFAISPFIQIFSLPEPTWVKITSQIDRTGTSSSLTARSWLIYTSAWSSVWVLFRWGWTRRTHSRHVRRRCTPTRARCLRTRAKRDKLSGTTTSVPWTRPRKRRLNKVQWNPSNLSFINLKSWDIQTSTIQIVGVLFIFH